MGLFASIEYGANVASNTMKWAWSWGKKPVEITARYAGNTLAYTVKQAEALCRSVPALVSPQQWKVVKAAGYITAYRLLPLVALHAASSYMQSMMPKQAQTKEEQKVNYLMYTAAITDLCVSLYSLRNNKGSPASKVAQTVAYVAKSATYLTAYVATPLLTASGAATSFPSAITNAAFLMKVGVDSYTYWQIPEAIARNFVMGMVAPAAFTQHKTEHSQPCKQEKCTLKRRLQGNARQPVIFLFNSGITFAISFIPRVGIPFSIMYGLLAHGSQIARLSRSNLCERHAGELDSTVMLATGGAYTLLTGSLDSLLLSTMGVPSLLALHYFVFLFLINNTAHMEIAQVPFGKGILPIDPIVLPEQISGIITDTFLKGSMKVLTRLLHPDPKKPPRFSISEVLKGITDLLNSDLEKVSPPPPTFFQNVKDIALPPMFRSTKDFVRDPVVRIFWDEQQEFSLFIVGMVVSLGIPVADLMKSSVPMLSGIIKTTLPKALYLQFDISEKFTKFILKLAKDEDIEQLVRALKGRLERLNVKERIALARTPAPQLNVGLLEGPGTPSEKRTLPALAPATPATPTAQTATKPEEKAPTLVTPSGKKDGVSRLDPSRFAFFKQGHGTTVTRFRQPAGESSSPRQNQSAS